MSLTIRSRLLMLCAWLLALALLAAPAGAEEQAFDFLHAAQDRGYGEVAIDYLEQLRAAGRLPGALVETLDLELSRSYRIAVDEAFNAAEAEQRMTKAQAHLDKFLKEHPNHPEVARAMESWGDITLARGLQRIGQASGTRDKAQQEKLLADARADLAEARPRLVEATAGYLDKFTRLKAALAAEGNPRSRGASPANRKLRELEKGVREAEMSWLECRSKCAKIDFYTGQTYLDKKAPQRNAALEAAAVAFDDLFQAYRESLVGLHAHLWHGRAVDELGNDQLALDIYDEVLAVAPDERERESGLEPLFAQAQYYRLLVILRKDGPQPFLAEANGWLKLRRNWTAFDGYRGVMLAVAKVNLQQAEALAGREKAAQVRAALDMLSDVAKAPGEHQQEAILLRRQHTQTSSTDPATVKTFDEGVALGEAAIENLDWTGAVALLARGLELVKPSTDKERIAQATTRLDQARYQLAAALYGEGKLQESLSAAEQIARERPDGPLAPPAMALACSAALTLYAQATDKQAAYARLEGLANDTIRRWPDKSEADDARIALGQASLVRGELAAAAAAFEKVNPRSLRYPIAMFMAGQTHWRLYLVGRSKPDADGAALAAMLTVAREQLQTSLDELRKAQPAGAAPDGQLTDAQLLLAEVQLESRQAEQAAALVEPLLASIRAARPKPLDNMHLRAFLAAARAQEALAQLANVAATAQLLVELGEDDPAVNGVLNSMLKLLVDRWKQSEADAIDARTAGDQARRATAESAIVERKKFVAELVPKLAARKQNTLTALIYIADTASQLGQTDTARVLYQSVLAQAEADPAFKQPNAPALTRIQSQLVGLLRQQNKFAEGLAEVNKLVEQFPNALEPKMEKGRLLQSWADVDPTHFDEAVAHWTMLRTRMARMTRKPPEYYEVVYNAAVCLFEEARKTSDRGRSAEKALQAEQLLNATRVLSPKLSGPEMVARYGELMQKLRRLRGAPASASVRN